MPLYAKPGSIIVYGNFERAFNYDYVDGAKAVIYGLEDGKTAETKLYNSEAELVGTVTAVRNGDTIKVTCTGGIDSKITVESAQGLKIEM